MNHDTLWQYVDAHLADQHEPRHARRAPLAERLTERGGRIVTVLLTLALVAFVVVTGSILGGPR